MKIEFYSKLSWVDEAVKLGIGLSKSWFRGQSQPYGELLPAAFRDFNREFFMKGSQESKFAIHFRRQAPAFSEYTPKDLDHLEWLFLMQHHGTPTRLLDWTENVLVALYFAVNSNFDKDGELWALYPFELNERSLGSFGIEITNSKYVKYLSGEPFHNNPEQLKEELKLERDINGPIAFYPLMRFPRMINQMSVFTIHPDPNENNSIEDLLAEEAHLVRYLIPKGRKKDLLSKLHQLGIRESTLFPNLDSLSKSIQQEMNTVAYSPPKPPRFHNID